MNLPMPELAQEGLALQAVFSLSDLTPDAAAVLSDLDPGRFPTLVLVGQAGPTLWERHVRHHLHLDHPFDEVTRRLVADWFDRHRPHAAWTVVYPGRYQLPLGQLATAAGWGEPSPLGLTIHSDYGLWVAHRLAFVTSAIWPTTRADASTHPCDTCASRPCESACPVGAVSLVSGFDVGRCAHFRAEPASPCAYRCLAREACPVGVHHRYGGEQMRHHYAAGLASIRTWLDGDG